MQSNLYLGPAYDFQDLLKHEAIIRVIAQRTHTLLQYDEEKNAVTVSGDQVHDVHNAFDELRKILLPYALQAPPRRGLIDKPDRNGRWGEPRVLERKRKIHPDSEEDEEHPTLALHRFLKDGDITEQKDLDRLARAGGVPTMLINDAILPRRALDREEYCYVHYITSIQSQSRDATFAMHCSQCCSFVLHPQPIVGTWDFKSELLERITLREEQRMLVQIQQIAEATQACLAYQYFDKRVIINTDNADTVQDILERLSAMEKFVQDNVINLPVPAIS
ncbi:uncharacterized protein EV422DRAFT_56988 [Fimicolochytrium jonesii]|uniref:uncharacterized protein n=1 Tax=Fimicolochytrium jonesii TaxID=1396493 RepID=UPI0022FEB3FE|nr:uncharacterized protein EV422DRAFT_56988 [Fimicolochytrium jonesii]KAI8820631.1 hypothetical protein EV422DRAFT_56988 [Fimicolochytrium jonesii]